MSQTATELLDAALALPGEHRLELAEALLASLDPSLRPPLDESWREVIRRRSAELRSGEVAGVAWDDVKRRAQDRGNG
jgi:putative addiction module component (TIGR02574 family)